MKKSSILTVIVMFCIIVAFIYIGYIGGNGSHDKKIDAWVCAEDVVSKRLKSPSSASFCSYNEAKITELGNSKYSIRGYVDAQNGFGAMIRSYFTVTLTLTADGYKDATCSIS